MSQRASEAQASETLDKEIAKAMSEPWIAMRSGITLIAFVSLAFAVFMTWQLYPTEGLGRAILFGLASAVAIWVIFGMSLSFNIFVRRRRGGS